MKLAKFDNIEWSFDPHGNFYLGLVEGLPENNSGDVVYAKIDPKEILAPHFHKRPTEDGYISFFFFQGGNVKVILPDTEDEIINTNNPFHITFEHLEKHGVENLSEKEVFFEIISAPKYIEGEETRL